MEDKKTIFDFAGMVLVTFGFCMIFMMLFTAIMGEGAKEFSTMFALGKKGVPVEVMMQFFALAVLITLARYLFFCDALIKKGSIAVRTAGMFLTTIIICACFIVVFRWFPVNLWNAWAGFFICFGISSVISIMVMTLREKMENRKMEEGLKKLRKQWEEEKMNSRIFIKNIVKEFGGHRVLKGIGTQIEEGEIFGRLGPSGAGKTTLIKILTGQLVQTEGEAELLGTDTRRLTDREYGRIGMMLDNTGVYERLSCYDNLLLFARIYGLYGEKPREALPRIGLWEAKNRPVQKLSKGMKQRLVLARVMMNEPAILFLDEPTSGLDPANAREIHRLIQKQQEKGTTVFLTTHNMEEAEKLCGHIALLFEGSIVEYGNRMCAFGKWSNRTFLIWNGL